MGGDDQRAFRFFQPFAAFHFDVAEAEGGDAPRSVRKDQLTTVRMRRSRAAALPGQSISTGSTVSPHSRLKAP